jgi:hypothetical protein
MALFDGSDESGGDLRPDEFYRGLSYLGKPTTITLPGQEQGPQGGALGSAVAPAPAAPSITGTPGAGSETIGSPSAGISPGIRALLTGASFGSRAANVASGLIGPSAIGAFETPSGQLTTSAPEILRELQFPSGAGDTALSPATEGTPIADLAGNVGGAIGTALPYAPSVLGIIQGILNRDPVAASEGATSGALTALGPAGADLIPAGAAAPIAAGASIIANIIRDMVQDPEGRVSAVQDYNYITSQAVPPQAQTLQTAASILPLISDKLTTDQAMQLFELTRAGVKSSELLADPISREGKSKAGVDYTNYPGLNEAVQQYAPQAILATIRLQDLLARRGISDPAAAPFTVPNAEQGPFGQFYGTPGPQQELQMQPEQVQFEKAAFPLGREGGSLYLTPGEAIGKIGHYGGFTETPAAETIAGALSGAGLNTYSPATMQALAQIQPGGLEAGLRAFLANLPGYAGSPFAGLEGTPEAAASPAAASSGGAGAGGGGMSFGDLTTSGEEFPFQNV